MDIEPGTIADSGIPRAHPTNQRYATFTTLLLTFLPGLTTSTGLAAEDRIVTRIVEAAFADAAIYVRTAIEGKGINIAHALPASDLLHRTALPAHVHLSYRVPICNPGTDDTTGGSRTTNRKYSQRSCLIKMP